MNRFAVLRIHSMAGDRDISPEEALAKEQRDIGSSGGAGLDGVFTPQL